MEHGSFTPLIVSSQGRMSKETTAMYKRLASLLSSKRSAPYSRTINWIRCRIGFALLRLMIMCLRGPAPPICTSSGTVQRIVILQWTLLSARGGSKQLLLFCYTHSLNYYCDCTIVLYCIAVCVLFSIWLFSYLVHTSTWCKPACSAFNVLNVQ